MLWKQRVSIFVVIISDDYSSKAVYAITGKKKQSSTPEASTLRQSYASFPLTELTCFIIEKNHTILLLYDSDKSDTGQSVWENIFSFFCTKLTFWRRLVRYSGRINEIVAWTLDCQISSPYLGVRWTDQAARESWRWTSPSRKYYHHQFRNSL